MPAVCGKIRSMANLVSIEDARELVLEAVSPLTAETVGLGAALGRVLAEEVVAGLDVPPFRNSAMDGYAVVAGAAAGVPGVGGARARGALGGALAGGGGARAPPRAAAAPRGGARV